MVLFFVCFKQKTAYEMRISDWSSDVCSSDLGGIQVLEGRGRRWVGQVISRNVNGLDGRNRARLGRSDALLQLTHFFGQCRLIAHSRWHTTQQCGHFGSSQRVAVNVVDEEENVAA